MTLKNLEALNFGFTSPLFLGFLVFIVYVITRRHGRNNRSSVYSQISRELQPSSSAAPDDSKFVADLLASDRATKIRQVSDSESSISESDC